MSKEFKPGDLALIINDADAENIGKVVKLEFLVKEGGEYQPPTGYGCLNLSGGPVWVVTAEGLSTTRGTTYVREGWAQKAPQNLMPLKGDEQPAQVRQAEGVQ